MDQTLIFTIDQETLTGILDTDEIVVLDVNFLDNSLQIQFEEIVYINHVKLSKNRGNKAVIGSDGGIYVSLPQLASAQW